MGCGYVNRSGYLPAMNPIYRFLLLVRLITGYSYTFIMAYGLGVLIGLGLKWIF